MDKLGFKDGEMIESGMISKSIERAQKKVEENTSVRVSTCSNTTT